MRYAPTESELKSLDGMGGDDLLQYATTRMVECEEVWSLGDDSGWLIREVGEESIISIWPYKQLAKESAVGELSGSILLSTSLEQFTFGVLKKCVDAELSIEVCKSPQHNGKIIPAKQLSELLESMIESGEYFVEG